MVEHRRKNLIGLVEAARVCLDYGEQMLLASQLEEDEEPGTISVEEWLAITSGGTCKAFLRDCRRVFLLQAAVLFASATVASKPSRRRNPGRRIVRRLKVRRFRVVNHARPIAELISVPLTDNHLDL